MYEWSRGAGELIISEYKDRHTHMNEPSTTTAAAVVKQREREVEKVNYYLWAFIAITFMMFSLQQAEMWQ
jgi:hypothetical protein